MNETFHFYSTFQMHEVLHSEWKTHFKHCMFTLISPQNQLVFSKKVLTLWLNPLL
uniref:Uncharacterized protein n=1 Tax=Anguilla anguilla TaxID=7936 RepID=A0A0E9S382_ANGAN